MNTDNTQMPKYRLTRRAYAPRAPGEPCEILEAGAEITYTGKPGANLLPVNIAAILAVGAMVGDAPAAVRLAEMEAERAAIWARLEKAHAERSRLLADDPKSANLKRLRTEIEDLRAAHREHGEAIDTLRSRAGAEIDDVVHARNVKRHDHAKLLAEKRAELVQGPLVQAVEYLAQAMASANIYGGAIRELAASGKDFERRLDAAGVVADHEEAVQSYVLAVLVERGVLSSQHRPPSPRPHGAEALPWQIERFAPEHPAIRRARTQAAADLERADREHRAEVQRRGREADGRPPMAGVA